MRFKKDMASVLAGAMTLSMAACGSESTTPATNDATESQAT